MNLRFLFIACSLYFSLHRHVEVMRHLPEFKPAEC